MIIFSFSFMKTISCNYIWSYLRVLCAWNNSWSWLILVCPVFSNSFISIKITHIYIKTIGWSWYRRSTVRMGVKRLRVYWMKTYIKPCNSGLNPDHWNNLYNSLDFFSSESSYLWNILWRRPSIYTGNFQKDTTHLLRLGVFSTF